VKKSTSASLLLSKLIKTPAPPHHWPIRLQAYSFTSYYILAAFAIFVLSVVQLWVAQSWVLGFLRTLGVGFFIRHRKSN